MRKKMKDCPRIFHVHWFRKNDQGKFMWPGFGENMRVLKWIIDRCHGRAYAAETTLGWMPRAEDIDLEGLDIDINDLRAMQTVDNADVKAEILSQEELFLKLAGDLPKEMIFQRELLISRVGVAWAPPPCSNTGGAPVPPKSIENRSTPAKD